MGRDDADVAGGDLDHLDLARCTAREGDEGGTEAGETRGVVGGFEDGELFWGKGEGVNVDAVKEGDYDAGLGYSDSEDGGAEFEGDDGFLVRVVPYDHLFEKGKSL